MDTVTLEHMLALIGSVTTLATLLSPALRYIAELTETTVDDDAVRLLDQLIALTGRLGWHKPKA